MRVKRERERERERERDRFREKKCERENIDSIGGIVFDSDKNNYFTVCRSSVILSLMGCS